MSFIQNARASADVVVATGVTVLILRDSILDELLKERLGLAASLNRSMAAELAKRLRAT